MSDDMVSRVDHVGALHMVNRMLTSLRNELAEARAEVKRLKAQLPDGGYWIVEYLAPTGIGFVEATSDATYQRRVWYGPVEPIEAEAVAE